jgi:tetratricopeptide (TPR) repeat protein
VGIFQPAVHRAILVVDVESFGDPARTNADQLAVRDAMYKALRQSFAKARISWADCAVEDRGDGVLVLVSPEVPKSRLVTRLPVRLADILGRHNAACPAPERIRLRMALHAGEVHRDAHGFAGTSVNRAFRLIEAPPSRTALRTSAGEVALIVSDWFYDEVVRHHPAAGPSCFRQVRVVMKETEMTAWVRVLGGQEALTQGDTGDAVPKAPSELAQPGEPSPSLLVVRHSLPPDTAAFTGREEELDRITAAVTQAGAGGIVAIHAIDGMPGVGKTALALHAAHLLRDRFPDRQLFIDLHAHTPGHDPLMSQAALAGLLSAVGVDARYLPEDLDGRAALWRDRMAGQRALLVLDNAASSAQVAPLLPGGEGCLVLVTSRRHIGDLPGAAVPLLLETLPPDRAQEMFVRLAPRAAAGPAAAVAELVKLAGYLPLAISLLARVYARHPSWTLADLTAETLANMRTLAAERNSVAAAFEVSYRYLAPGQQEFFRGLGLHPGTTIDAYAAAALAGTGLQDAAGQLDALHGEGLLTEAGYRRYGMHDLIRRYARDRAAADPAADREQALGRLLDYYQHTAAITQALLASSSPAVALAPAAPPAAVPDLPDHARALSWARAERASLLACLDHVTGTGQKARVVALTAAVATLLRLDGPWSDAVARHAVAVQAARHLGDRRGQANGLTNLGTVRRLAGDYPGAAQVLEEALGLHRDLGVRRGQANALLYLGAVRLLTGDFPGAARVLEEALGLYRDLGDRGGEAEALNEAGSLHRVRGDLSVARTCHRQALDLAREFGSSWDEAHALAGLGRCALAAGRAADAEASLRQAREIFQRTGAAEASGVSAELDALTKAGPAV